MKTAYPQTESTRQFSLSSKTLSLVALGLWLASLPFAGLVLYAGQRELKGIEILASGWLSPLVFNFAWFANPAFVITVLRLLKRKGADGLAFISIFLALDTTRFSSYVLDEGGGSTGVYGYGWGAVFWFASICVLLAAAGTLAIEEKKAEHGAVAQPTTGGVATRFIGFALLIFVILFSGCQSYNDHRHANQPELKRLKGLAFKRAPVCTSAEPAAFGTINISNGVLEVVAPNGAYPFNEPQRFLEWGVPKVRFGDRDYYYTQAEGKQLFVSDTAIGASIAKLLVETSIIDGKSQYRAKLIATDAERVIFNQTWLTETHSGERYCPEFSSFPSANIQPRKLLMDALQFATPAMPVSTQVAMASTAPQMNSAVATILEVKEYVDRPRPRGSRGEWDDPRPLGSLGWRGNRNCPKDVGWERPLQNPGSPQFDTAWSFLVGKTKYHAAGIKAYNALCQGDAVYLSSASNQDGKNLLRIQKRSLSNFELKWDGTLIIEKQLTARPDDLKLNHVTETASGVNVQIINEDGWTDVVLSAPLTTSK